MNKNYYLLSIIIVISLFSCKKEPIIKQPSTIPLSRIDSLRQLFIPKTSWNGKLKSISIYNKNGNHLSNTEIKYYYDIDRVIGQIITYDNSSYLIDTVLYKYNTFMISTHSLYDTIEQSFVYGSIYGKYFGNLASNHALFFDTITSNLSFIEKPMFSLVLINRVYIVYNSNNIAAIGYYWNADGIGANTEFSNLSYSTDSFNYQSYYESNFGQTYTEHNSIKSSNIVNTQLLDFMNSLLFLTQYNENTFGNTYFSLVYPFPIFGYPNFQFIDKIPSSSIVYNVDTNEKVSETNFSYDVSGNKINKIVIHTYKYPPIDKSYSDSLVFSYY